ncbi:hypothetical protein [Silanimonas sp.]|jgi:hypothetical protein|uniref:hypothetical protein n=1 Tax=Silanimonas sp. TaxID=1929290 RepID=UPI0037C88C6C
MALSVGNWRLRLAALAAGLVALHLGWEWSQGGIASHHFLADASMPSISNVWGLLWLPLLAFLYAPSIRRRAIGTGLRPRWRFGLLAGLLGGLAAGGAIAAFVVVRPDIEGTWILGSLLALSLAFPVWRGEIVLGFLAGAMVAIGTILPSIFAFAFATISVVVHRGLVPGLKHLWKRASGR